jgi:hypothetical protein
MSYKDDFNPRPLTRRERRAAIARRRRLGYSGNPLASLLRPKRKLAWILVALLVIGTVLVIVEGARISVFVTNHLPPARPR